MVCYTCGGDTQVINSRPQKRLNQVWRRRQCTLCDTLLTTQEAIDYSKSLRVSRPGQRQLLPLERDRLFMSIYKSLGHRKTAMTDAAALAATIITKAVPQAENGVLDSTQLKNVALVALSRFDTLGAQHYAAFHP